MAVTFPDNPRFKQVATEFGHGAVAGSLYSSQIRILMRSPTHVLFVGLGLQSWDRQGHGGWHSLRTIIRQVKIDTLKLPAVVERIEEIFGEGSAEAALAAWRTRGKGTVLVDGGGDAMPLPRVVQAKQNHDRWLAVTPTQEVDLTGQVKTCRQCGENLRPQCDNHFLGYEILPDRPKTLEDCQRLTNYQVIRVTGFRDLERAGHIEAFFTWDGESYQDDLFCSEQCAKTYARRAARELAPLPVGGVPVEPETSRTSVVHHYDTERAAKRQREEISRIMDDLQKPGSH